MLKSKNMIVINSDNLQLLGEYELYTSKMTGESYEVIRYVKLVDGKGNVVHETGNNLHIRIESLQSIENEVVVALENNFINLIDELCYKCLFRLFEVRIKQYMNRVEAEERTEYIKAINEENKKLKKELFEVAALKNLIIVNMYDSIEIYEKLNDKVSQRLFNCKIYSDDKERLCKQLIEGGHIKLINSIKNDTAIYNTHNEIVNNNYKSAIEYIS